MVASRAKPINRLRTLPMETMLAERAI
jgi:hypothetical protein